MNITFFDRARAGSPLNGTVIRETDQLLRLFASLHGRPPFVCELVGENGFSLHVGVGTDGHAQYSSSDGAPPYLLAVTPGEERQGDEIEFMMGRTPTPIPNRNCMPFHHVEEIAKYFLQTGLAHSAFVWEAV